MQLNIEFIKISRVIHYVWRQAEELFFAWVAELLSIMPAIEGTCG